MSRGENSTGNSERTEKISTHIRKLLAPGRALALTICALLLSVHGSSAEMTVVDVAGRHVELQRPAERIILEVPAYYTALSLLDGDAADKIVATGGTEANDLFEAEHDLSEKPRLGWLLGGSFSIEKALSLKPDLLIATLTGPGQQWATEAAFKRAGVPIIYVDFFVDPAKNTIPSMEAIGRALGKEKQASEFIGFYRSHVDKVIDRIRAAHPAKPKLLMTAKRPEQNCCLSFARSGVTSFFEQLNVVNLAKDRAPGKRPTAELSPEYVIEANPDIIVATDGATGPKSLFGAPRTRANAVAALEEMTADPRLHNLAAVRARRVHAIDPSLNRSPLNVLAIELFAKWLHPELFADIDPQETLDEINARFLATPLKGPFWASLEPVPDRHP